MERLDDILGYKNLKIYQNSDYFSFSLDSIILANFANIRLRDKNIVDFCTGNGIIPIIIANRCTNADIVGVEVQEKLADMASRSVEYNGLVNRVKIVCDDIKNFSKENLNFADLIICNPPYFKVSENSSLNILYEKKIARHEILLNLDELCDCAKKVLKDNGNFCLIHRSDRLIEILFTLKKYNLEPKKIKFFYDNISKNSNLVYIEAQKCGNTGLIVDNPFIFYNLDGSITGDYKKLQEEINI